MRLVKTFFGWCYWVGISKDLCRAVLLVSKDLCRAVLVVSKDICRAVLVGRGQQHLGPAGEWSHLCKAWYRVTAESELCWIGVTDVVVCWSSVGFISPSILMQLFCFAPCTLVRPTV